jgi:hypothetical protein
MDGAGMSYHIVEKNGRIVGIKSNAMFIRAAQSPAPRSIVARSAMLIRSPIAPRVIPRGRQVLMTGPETTAALGFSLRPPKWVRKAQPGKVLKKAIIPIAVVGATLLIPGVGGAVVGAVTAAAKASGGFVGRIFGKGITVAKTVTTAVKPVAPLVQQIAPMALPMMPGSVPAASAPSTPTPVSMTPQSAAPEISSSGSMFTPSASAASDQATGGSGAASTGMPGWVIPAGLGLVVFAMMSRRR